METRRLIAPASFPLSLLQAKQRQRIEADDSIDDDLIQEAIETMLTDAESNLMRSIVQQTWNGYPIAWPAGGCIVLPYGNNGVNSIKYYDEDDTESTFTDFTVDPGSDPVGGDQSRAGRIWLTQDSDWPTGELRDHWPIVIEFTAGWPTGNPWQQGKAYAAGEIVIPTTGNTLAYQSDGGTADTSEPTWGLETGGTTADNDIIWTCLGITVPAAVRNIVNLSVSTDYDFPDEILPFNHPNLHVLAYLRRRVWLWRISEETTP